MVGLAKGGHVGRLLLLLVVGALMVGPVACGLAPEDSPLEDQEVYILQDRLLRSEDGESLFLEGEVRNASDREVAFVHLRVRFYDSLGNLVRTISGNPEPAKIEAGARSSFRLEIPYDPAISEYRVEITTE
jgi:hypothetical protein